MTSGLVRYRRTGDLHFVAENFPKTATIEIEEQEKPGRIRAGLLLFDENTVSKVSVINELQDFQP